MKETVGFIGLGDQGAPIARRIVEAGYPMVLWARRKEQLDPFAGTRATFADDIESLARAAHHVGVCVVDDSGVRDVCARLVAAMRAGGRIAIHSTVHPDTCRAVAAEAGKRGISVVDAPVSGGAPAAAKGELTVMVGGDVEAVEAARPIFETFSALIVRLGVVGAGQAAKLVNNTLLAANMALAHHALQASAALGLDRAALAGLIKASSGRSFGFEVYARLPSPAAFAHGGALLDKDARLLAALLAEDEGGRALVRTARAFLDFIPGTDKRSAS
ncbi:MAG: NAD(P)-dependent oxidoreductase [Parvularculaceae bacterium]|nr:NAD(P)-dependent oxidoreductase [Parvularculaceae bacterium]